MLSAGQPQHVGLGGITMHGDQTGCRGTFEDTRIGVDDHNFTRN
ncbi:Uncharacterised protein [Mycobacterium tuberculosis]|nr:Uncharacterised protein [Mycobacterium tuberculosis]CNV45912.1 Uncharacterised protein [Mycobacterium tuberculosis]CNV58889.1 Uncharacterised protein [Mycobacterium tuberculosis]COY31379.1 Uncharacterised protein [Mycobacterium tuberculosis]COZ15857.1 Uncharacterised protein [Mycobacterium tuberculosis]